MLYMFGLLFLVLVGMKVAANPKTWNWMFAGGQSTKTEPEKTKSAKQPTERKSLPRLRPDEFLATTKTAKSQAKTVAKKSEKKVDTLPGITFPAKMDDRELGITKDEWPAYVAVLDHVFKQDVDELRKKSRKRVNFTNLRQTPDALRGAVITIEGRLGSLRKIPPPKNDHGLGQLYEAWIVTDQSDNLPYRVVFSEIPEGLEPKDLFQPPPDVRVTGYFFKVEKYEAQPNGEKWRYEYAPLLLARRIDLAEEPTSRGLSLAPFVIGFALLIGGILAIAMWRFTRGDKQFADEHLSRFEERKHEEATNLNRHEAGESPEQFFARLSGEDEGSKS